VLPTSPLAQRQNRELIRLATQAREAIRAGDCIIRDSRLQELKSLRDSLRGAIDTEPDPATRGELQQIQRDTEAAIGEIERQVCPPARIPTEGVFIPSVPSRPLGYSVGAEFAVGNLNAQPTDFFIFRNPITGEERRNIFSPSANTTLVSGGGSFSIDLGNVLPIPGQPTFDFSYNFATGSTSVAVGTIDPLGQRLGIIGTGDETQLAPGGVLLGTNVPLGTPGGANVLRDVFYRRDIDINRFGGTITLPARFAPYGTLFFLTPVAEFSYTRMEINEFTSFSIPGFFTDGAYNSNYVNDLYTASLGVRVDVPVGAITVDPANPSVIYIKGLAGVGFSNVDGFDSLNLSGSINTDQRVGLSADHTGFVGSLTGGVRFNAGNFFADGSVTIATIDAYPRLLRTGEIGQTTQVQFERATGTSFLFRAGVQLGGPIGAGAPRP
jgi:hypothetical protein